MLWTAVLPWGCSVGGSSFHWIDGMLGFTSVTLIGWLTR